MFYFNNENYETPDNPTQLIEINVITVLIVRS